MTSKTQTGSNDNGKRKGDRKKLDLMLCRTFLMMFSTSNISDGISDWDSIENTTHFYNLDGKGQITSEKLLETKLSIEILIPYGARSVGTPVAFTGKLLTSFSDDGNIYVNWSDDFLIKVYSNTGEYKHAFRS